MNPGVMLVEFAALIGLSVILGVLIGYPFGKRRSETKLREYERAREEEEQKRAVAVVAVRRDLRRMREGLADLTALYEHAADVIEHEFGGVEGRQLTLDLKREQKLIEHSEDLPKKPQQPGEDDV